MNIEDIDMSEQRHIGGVSIRARHPQALSEVEIFLVYTEEARMINVECETLMGGKHVRFIANLSPAPGRLLPIVEGIVDKVANEKQVLQQLRVVLQLHLSDGGEHYAIGVAEMLD